MAGERIGKTYEALLYVVLERLRSRGVFSDHVFWNVTPEGISVEPDFLLGIDKNHPSVIIMVTHLGSSKESEKKCWRNIGELCEVKTALVPTPVAINIIFDGIMKENLKALQAAVFDSQVIISDTNYGEKVRAWVYSHEPILPVNQEEKAECIISSVDSDEMLREIIEKLEEELQHALQGEQSDLKQVWEMEAERPHRFITTWKKTYVRRGVSKLLIFDDVETAIKLYRGKQVSISDLPEYVYSISLAKKAIGKAAQTDAEIENAVSLLSNTQIRTLYHSMDDNETVNSWRTQLRNIPSIEYMGLFVLEHYDNITKADNLYQYAKALYSNAKALTASKDPPIGWNPEDVWLINYVMELIKAASGRANGYGFAQLATAVIEAGYGTAADQSSATQFGGGFGFSAWIMRKPSPFRDDLLQGVAFVLSAKLREIGLSKIKRLIESHEVENSMVANLIEAKLCTYRMFEPLYILMKQKVPSIEQVQYRTCFAEKAGLTGQAGKTTVARVRNTIINWQSAYDSGRDHKRKELCGRAIGLRYSWDRVTNSYIKRPGIQKFILFIDGTWTQKDIDSLLKAGWDEIYYPDETDKLKAAIV